MLVSYAQNFEDVLLWRALGNIENGFYIDIGAQDPVVDSISLSFYERGWRGVHVEPTPAYAQALREARPDETVVQAAIGDEQGLIPFFEIPRTGISTGDAEIAHRHEASGFTTQRLEVPCVKLSVLLDGYKDRDIHWMKIDVEGMEQSVLRGWAPSSVRPWIVVVESTLPLTTELSYETWEASLVELGYRFAYFDGLNRFYVSRTHLELLKAFKAPPNVFDLFSLAGTGSHHFCDKLNEAVTRARGEVHQLATFRAELENKLKEARQDGDASQARVAELERRVSEQAEQVELYKQEAFTSAQHLAQTLRGLEEAKAESVELLHRLAAKSDAYEAQVATAHAESARQIAELVRQRDDALGVAAQRQDAFDAARLLQDSALSELRESEASRLREAKQAQLAEQEHGSRIQSLLKDQLLREQALQEALRANTESARAVESDLQHQLAAERRLQHEVRATLEHARRELEAVHASWIWRISKAARLPKSPASTFPTVVATDRSTSAERLGQPQRSSMIESTQVSHAAGSVEQLLSLHDDEFVRCAYLTILRRPADAGGFANYLAELREGTPKEKIVLELANSSEGRALGHVLPGLSALIGRMGRRKSSLVYNRIRRLLGWPSRADDGANAPD